MESSNETIQPILLPDQRLVQINTAISFHQQSDDVDNVLCACRIVDAFIVKGGQWDCFLLCGKQQQKLKIIFTSLQSFLEFGDESKFQSSSKVFSDTFRISCYIPFLSCGAYHFVITFTTQVRRATAPSDVIGKIKLFLNLNRNYKFCRRLSFSSNVSTCSLD